MAYVLIRCVALVVFLFNGSAYALKRDVSTKSEWVFVRGAAYQNIHTVNMNALEFGLVYDKRCMFYITPPPICQKKVLISGWMIKKSSIPSIPPLEGGVPAGFTDQNDYYYKKAYAKG